MRRPHFTARGRGPTEEVESSWLGAEALPGGAPPREATGPAEREAASRARGLRASGPVAWLTAAWRWTRRGRVA